MTSYTAETPKVSNMARTQKVSNMMCVMRSPRSFRIAGAGADGRNLDLVNLNPI